MGTLDVQTYVFVEDSITLSAISYTTKQVVSKGELELTSYQKMTSHTEPKKLKAKSSVDKIISSGKKDELYGDTLFNFIFSLEVEIFTVDSPEFPFTKGG